MYAKITSVSLLLVALLACGDSFTTAQSADTVEAYEQYLEANPNGRFVMEAQSRLADLVLEHAAKTKSLEAYDAFLARFPQSVLRTRALEEREALLYAWSKETNTVESWQRFLDEYPKAQKKQRKYAKRMVSVHAYLPNLEVTAPQQQQINLAEDPEGPLDGWEFTVDVTNNGTETLTDLRITIQYLSPEGGVLQEREWPVVAEFWSVPVEEERKVPMKPGETRDWVWTSGDLPERWDRRVNVFVSRISLAR